ncbi:hypothetical protein HK096_002983, partial [Nowakowskiella sp. JEL0078]
VRPYSPYWKTWTKLTPISQKSQKNYNEEKKESDVFADESKNENFDLAKPEQIASSTYGPGPQTHRVWFDVYNTSPLVTRYLKVYGFGNAERRALKIHRSEMVRCVTPPDSPTYRDLISQSSKSSRKMHRQYQRTVEDISRDRAEVQQHLSTELQFERKKFLKLVSRPQTVKEHANKIVEDMIESRQKTFSLRTR